MAKSKETESKIEEIKSEVQVSATHEIQKGVYSNLTLIHHTENEFIFDFIMKFGGETQLVSRVIMSPKHMKALIDAATENYKKFEEKYLKAKKEK